LLYYWNRLIDGLLLEMGKRTSATRELLAVHTSKVWADIVTDIVNTLSRLQKSKYAQPAVKEGRKAISACVGFCPTPVGLCPRGLLSYGLLSGYRSEYGQLQQGRPDRRQKYSRRPTGHSL